MMRKFAGPLIGVALSLLIGGPVMAGLIGPSSVFNVSPGWNSPIFDAGAGTVTFRIRWCMSSVNTLKYDLMHHWPLLPSTGMGHQSYTCANNDTWVAHSWAVTAATYSEEYEKFQNGTTTATFVYSITYP